MNLNGEIAKAQIEDRIRAAQLDHTARGRSNRAGTRRVVRRVGSGVLGAVAAVLARRPVPAQPAARVTPRC
jgi:hypothetical protein